MRTRIHALLLVLSLGLVGWALFGNLAGCSNEKKHVNPPIVGPAAGSGPTGGGETQRIELLASPSETLTTLGDEQGVINITALIENNIGQPMPDGTPVYWSTTEGTLDSMSTTSSNGSSSTALTFPVGYNGCSTVTARSGDASASIRLCVQNIQATPTPTATATPVPTAAPAATATPVQRTLEIVSPSPPSYTHTCAASPAGDLTVSALAANGGIPENGIPVTFAVYGSGLGPAPATSINTNSSGIASHVFLGDDCVAGEVTTVVVSTTDGRTASIVITTN